MLLTAGSVSAQYFGRNKVQYDDFDWQVMSTENFDIHFYPEAMLASDDGARMIERWNTRLEDALQHRLLADDDLKLKQMHELLVVHFTRRKLDPGALEYGKPEKAAGDSVRQVITVKQGIDKELAKKITKAIKDSKMKVQASIQGDELRVTGKKIDDLQAAISMVKGLKIEQPLQYINFRD